LHSRPWDISYLINYLRPAWGFTITTNITIAII
jgi:hypothetical protein